LALASLTGGDRSIGIVRLRTKKPRSLLAARILTVDFVVCTLAVKKKIRAGFDMSDRTIPLLFRAILNCRVSELVIVFTICKCSINEITSPNHVCSHTLSRDNILDALSSTIG
jgi:hypothetical protein